jgi:hypothetical protein
MHLRCPVWGFYNLKLTQMANKTQEPLLALVFLERYAENSGTGPSHTCRVTIIAAVDSCLCALPYVRDF